MVEKTRRGAKRLKKSAALAPVVYLIVYMVIAPQSCVESARYGLRLCAETVVPSLFPFFVVSSLFMSLGAGELDRARLYGKRFLIATPLMAQAFALLVILPLSGPIVSLFPVSAETARMAREMIYILCGATWLNALNTVIIVSILRTGGDVRMAAAIDVGSLWLVGVPAAWVAGLIFKWDITLVYLVTYLEQLSKAAAAIWRYRQSRWIRSIVREGA